MRTKQRNNLAETARHERFAQNTDVYVVKASNYKGVQRGSPVYCRNNWHIHHATKGGEQRNDWMLCAESLPERTCGTDCSSYGA